MDAIDRRVYQGSSPLPPVLVHRYRNDPVFHRLVRVLLQLLQDTEGAEISAADIREASLVAEELRREIRIQERMNEPIEMKVGTVEPGRDATG